MASVALFLASDLASYVTGTVTEVTRGPAHVIGGGAVPGQESLLYGGSCGLDAVSREDGCRVAPPCRITGTPHRCVTTASRSLSWLVRAPIFAAS